MTTWLSRAWLRREPWWVEVLSGSLAAGWAAHVLAFHAKLAAMPSYAVIGRFLPDQGWALTGLLGGVLQVAAVALDLQRARAAAAAAMGCFWLLLADGLCTALPGSPTVVLFAGLGVVDAVALVHALAVRR